ncbi:APC membrane recruitment protein 2-like [Takifugu rubripes]|uniref:APC membrane recruitment protein 2-like n=1 Tax=Takifugu rubripes TaxID=31033 RepID=UPI001145E6AE|nr:APC membrane recruitment protein 2-like [Takifugu rubripes]
MDVQKESMDPLPCESQSSGKIRKGFKLFGKRKPGNIFTIRNKGDGHNKSPVNKSKSLDGLSETGEADLVQEPDTDRGQEVSQGEMEQREEEALGEDGIQAFAHSRNSISSTSSARSLKFLSLLRGGRLGTGDRRVHTVSQPVGRQRRGLKGLFGTVRLRSKDKDCKGEVPPSPLLKSSRANSVEIIKEDLTLTPKVQPRLLDSPEQENTEPVESVSSQDSTPTTPPATVASRVPTDNVSRADEYVPPLPTSQPPLEPGDNSLNNLLADISSLLTFESISGGGDVIANVEAEWGKANATSKPTSPLYKPLTPSALTSTTASYSSVEKASSVAITMAIKPEDPPALKTDEDVLVSLAKVSPAPDSESVVILAPLSAPIPSPDSSLSLPSWPSEAPSKTGGSGEISLDEQVGSSTSNKPPRAQTVPSKKGEQHNASQVNLKSSSKEGKTHHAKPSGLSKIPVVGGGRAGKLPVRERQHVDNGADRGPPTPETEKQRPHFNSHDAGGKNKSPEVGTVGLTSKRTQERSQQPPQPKALTSSPRDTKIPMKHSPHPHYACQIPVARDTPRTKIPVSRVPVRRAGNKPADASGSSQIRK